MSFAHGFLLLSGVLFLFAFALPLLLATRVWARVFRWPGADEASPLAMYFGRCLGAAAVAITGVALRYAGSPAHQPLLLELIALAGAILTGVHVWGAVERSQPWTEDAEIVLYAGVTAVAFYARLTL